MRTISDAAVSRGDMMKRLERLEGHIKQQRHARRLEAAAVGRGGVRVHGGGGVGVQDGGSLVVHDGGSISARYPDGSTSAMWGRLILLETGLFDGHGLLVKDNLDGNNNNILRAKRNPNGTKVVWLGSVVSVPDDVNAIDEFAAEAHLTRIRNYGPDGTFVSAFGDDGFVVLAAYSSAAQSVDDPDTRLSLSTSINLNSGNQINLRSDASPPQVRVDAGETTNSANMVWVSPNGRLAVSTSSRRYKEDIQDAVIDPDRVLALRPRTWVPAGAAAAVDLPDDVGPDNAGGKPRGAGSPPPQRGIGFIAEEVADAGLDEFVTRDEGGAPRAVQYDRLTAALVTLCQQQQRRIESLEQRVSALEGGG